MKSKYNMANKLQNNMETKTMTAETNNDKEYPTESRRSWR